MALRSSSLIALALLLAACGRSASTTTEQPAPSAEKMVSAAAPPTVEDDPTVLPTPTRTPAVQPPATPEPESDCLRLTDFEIDAENLTWFIVNDNVMGGRSSGGPSFAETTVIFEGEINTDGGGFSSIRVQLTPGALAGYRYLRLRADTDGRPYKFVFQDGSTTQGRRVSHQAPLVFDSSPGDDWQIAEVDFGELTPRIFGREVESESFRPDLADQLGIMLSDGVDGPFRIEIDWIDICR